MMKTTVLRPILACVGGLAISQELAFGQSCDVGWTENLFPLAGVDGEVHATYTWDDGDGPAVYIGGEFTIAGSVNASNIASWDGQRWEALGDGTDGVVRSFGVFDDGSGESLYAGGDFLLAGGLDAAHIARWDGSQWSALDDGVNGPVYAMTEDDGRLYIGGEFSLAGGETARNLAWWDGRSWSVPPNGTSGPIRALLVHDDGSGERLYVGGSFSGAGGGVLARGIAAWDPATQIWAEVGGGVNGSAASLAIYNGSGDSVLVVAGRFSQAGSTPADNIAQWDGAFWQALGLGTSDDVEVLDVIDLGDGAGPMLFAGGEFDRAGEDRFITSGIARWDGSQWAPVGVGISTFLGSEVRAIAGLPTTEGVQVVAGGAITFAGQIRGDGIARFVSGAWDAMSAGLARQSGGGNRVDTIIADANPVSGGSDLIAGGSFHITDGVEVDAIGQWDGEGWTPFIGGEQVSGAVQALAWHDDGSGRALYASGPANSSGHPIVMRWDGSEWSVVGDDALTFAGFAMIEHDDGSGSALYVGGPGMRTGAAGIGGIARWNGQTWEEVGGGVSSAVPINVEALAEFDDGRGMALYVGGRFASAGGVEAHSVARWDGSDWESLGEGMPFAWVYALTVHDDGSGPALYAGGRFAVPGAPDSFGVAKWDGVEWTPLGPGLASTDSAHALISFDNGSGPSLYAAGSITTAGGLEVDNIARWDGPSLTGASTTGWRLWL